MNEHSPRIPPYWTRFGSFFIYPLSMEPLLACLGFGALSGLASIFFVPANIILEVVLLVATLRYGYKVLERTARGYLDDKLVFVDSAHGGKYLQVQMVLEVAVPEAEHLLASYQPKIQHALILLLSSKDVATLLTLKGKKDLMEEIIETVNHQLHETEKTGIKEVFFTSFIIQ